MLYSFRRCPYAMRARMAIAVERPALRTARGRAARQAGRAAGRIAQGHGAGAGRRGRHGDRPEPGHHAVGLAPQRSRALAAARPRDAGRDACAGRRMRRRVQEASRRLQVPRAPSAAPIASTHRAQGALFLERLERGCRPGAACTASRQRSPTSRSRRSCGSSRRSMRPGSDRSPGRGFKPGSPRGSMRRSSRE